MINNPPTSPEFQLSLSKNAVPASKQQPQQPVLLIVANREN